MIMYGMYRYGILIMYGVYSNVMIISLILSMHGLSCQVGLVVSCSEYVLSIMLIIIMYLLYSCILCVAYYSDY